MCTQGTLLNLQFRSVLNLEVLNLTLVSRNAGGRREWDILEVTSAGTDHFPMFCNLFLQRNKRQGEIIGK